MRNAWLIAVAASAALATPAWSSDVRDSRYGYSISLPDFGAAPAGSTVPLVFLAGPPVDGFSPNVNVTVQEVKVTIEQFKLLTEAQMTAAGIAVRSQTQREVSGYPALLVEYNLPPTAGQRRQVRCLTLSVVLPERVILVTYTATEGAFGKLEPEFRRSLESFVVPAPAR